MGERDFSPAQDWSALDFIEARAALQHDLERDGWVVGDRIPDDSRHYLDFMRNAVVAYHAGADWMHRARPGEVSRLRGECLAMSNRNARLREEVERLRSELRRAAICVRAWGRQSAMNSPHHSTALAKFADRLDALAREDGAP